LAALPMLLTCGLSLHDALPIWRRQPVKGVTAVVLPGVHVPAVRLPEVVRQGFMAGVEKIQIFQHLVVVVILGGQTDQRGLDAQIDRKSTRLNSSHVSLSYAVFC